MVGPWAWRATYRRASRWPAAVSRESRASARARLRTDDALHLRKLARLLCDSHDGLLVCCSAGLQSWVVGCPSIDKLLVKKLLPRLRPIVPAILGIGCMAQGPLRHAMGSPPVQLTASRND